MEIKQIPILDLIPYQKNARTHSEAQVAQIAASITEFGFTNPVLLDGNNGIIAGHGRVIAAQKLGILTVPCIELAHLTPTQKKAYILADNKIALNAGWDDELLRLELGELEELNFNLDLTGFSTDEIDALKPEQIPHGLTDEDAVPDLADPISKPGDVWLLGKHRIMCGDSTSIDAVEKLMDGQKADMVFTDPPYGVSIVKGQKIVGDKPFGSKDSRGTVGATNVVKANLYAPIAGDDTIDVAIEAIQVIKTLGAKVEIIWGGNYYANSLPNSSCWIVWDKQNTGYFADCELAWTNQTTAVRKFEHMWNGMIKASEHGQKRVHPTQKPVALAAWCLEQYGDKCKTVLDLFGGSGSTLIACEKTARDCRMMELDPRYVTVILQRWADFTGKDPILESTGQTFSELKNASNKA